MPNVKFTSSLRRYFPNLEDGEYEGETLFDLLETIEGRHKGFLSYILDEQLYVRTNVAVGIEGVFAQRSYAKEIPLQEHSEVHIWQALSGG